MLSYETESASFGSMRPHDGAAPHSSHSKVIVRLNGVWRKIELDPIFGDLCLHKGKG